MCSCCSTCAHDSTAVLPEEVGGPRQGCRSPPCLSHCRVLQLPASCQADWSSIDCRGASWLVALYAIALLLPRPALVATSLPFIRDLVQAQPRHAVRLIA
jgi:hypothetical protein